ncbi:hypothetical protein [Pseudomonas monteilii]|uniref:hypothetical protein n=1 Tax=Pseudomonas monteilii TaxID=76759 RepID=UPI001CBADA80|nr:hypothetical protein [Pseudomonas monteilii]MBZ3666592.1 hypothetical protein [Pseudomonas monteilii]MBZ3671917.1 hypothetical protein [Pseudomonas monteilii]
MPTENRSSNTDPRDVFIRLNPLGLGEAELRKHSTGFEDPRTHSDYLLFLAGYRETHPAPQPHSEPIAWMVGTAFWWTKEEAERDSAATGKTVTPIGPMFDTGEVDQLSQVIRNLNDERDELGAAVGRLRAQLAERDALLTKMKALFRVDDPFDLYDAVCAVLSARAEPSEPTPQAVNGHRLCCKAVDDYRPGKCSCGVEIDHEIPGTSFQRLNALANQGE